MTKDEELEKILLETQYYVFRPSKPKFIYLDGTFSIYDLQEIIKVLEK